MVQGDLEEYVVRNCIQGEAEAECFFCFFLICLFMNSLLYIFSVVPPGCISPRETDGRSYPARVELGRKAETVKGFSRDVTPSQNGPLLVPTKRELPSVIFPITRIRVYRKAKVFNLGVTPCKGVVTQLHTSPCISQFLPLKTICFHHRLL